MDQTLLELIDDIQGHLRSLSQKADGYDEEVKRVLLTASRDLETLRHDAVLAQRLWGRVGRVA